MDASRVSCCRAHYERRGRPAHCSPARITRCSACSPPSFIPLEPQLLPWFPEQIMLLCRLYTEHASWLRWLAAPPRGALLRKAQVGRVAGSP